MSDSKKNKILLLSFLSSLWVCYILAISPTLALKKEAKFLEKKHLQNQETLLELNRFDTSKKTIRTNPQDLPCIQNEFPSK